MWSTRQQTKRWAPSTRRRIPGIEINGGTVESLKEAAVDPTPSRCSPPMRPPLVSDATGTLRTLYSARYPLFLRFRVQH